MRNRLPWRSDQKNGMPVLSEGYWYLPQIITWPTCCVTEVILRIQSLYQESAVGFTFEDQELGFMCKSQIIQISKLQGIFYSVILPICLQSCKMSLICGHKSCMYWTELIWRCIFMDVPIKHWCKSNTITWSTLKKGSSVSHEATSDWITIDNCVCHLCYAILWGVIKTWELWALGKNCMGKYATHPISSGQNPPIISHLVCSFHLQKKWENHLMEPCPPPYEVSGLVYGLICS